MNVSAKWVFASGSSLGALVGLFSGLSTTPLVATTMAALLTIVAALLGIRLTKAQDGSGVVLTERLVVGATGFAIACLIVSPMSLYARTHGCFAPKKQMSNSPAEVATADLTAMAKSLGEIECLVAGLAPGCDPSEHAKWLASVSEGMPDHLSLKRRVLLVRKFESWPAGLRAAGVEAFVPKRTLDAIEDERGVFYKLTVTQCESVGQEGFPGDTAEAGREFQGLAVKTLPPEKLATLEKLPMSRKAQFALVKTMLLHAGCPANQGATTTAKE